MLTQVVLNVLNLKIRSRPLPLLQRVQRPLSTSSVASCASFVASELAEGKMSVSDTILAVMAENGRIVRKGVMLDSSILLQIALLARCRIIILSDDAAWK